MKRSSAEIVSLREQELSTEVNHFGHIKKCGANDMRPGWVRDREAGLELSFVQRLAERTRGVTTIANAMTLGGVALIGIAAHKLIKGDYRKAAVIGAVGAAMDMEGKVARATGTDNPGLGGALDASADFIKAAEVAVVGRASGAVPPGALALTYGPKVVNAANTIVTKWRNPDAEPYTDTVDKAVEVLRWVPVGLFGASHATRGTEASKVLQNAGWVATASAAVAGVYSSFRQYKRAKGGEGA